MFYGTNSFLRTKSKRKDLLNFVNKNVGNEEIYAFYTALKTIKEYRSLYEFPETKCIYFSPFPNKITLYYYLEDVVNAYDYLAELNEISNKYYCFTNFCWSQLRICFFYEHKLKKIL